MENWFLVRRKWLRRAKRLCWTPARSFWKAVTLSLGPVLSWMGPQAPGPRAVSLGHSPPWPVPVSEVTGACRP